MLDLQTVNDVFEHMSSRGDATVVLWKTGGEWKPITSQQMYGRVRALVETLQGWGVKKGDRVALMSENRWEWAVADFAALAMGAVDVPLYQTLTPEQTAHAAEEFRGEGHHRFDEGAVRGRLLRRRSWRVSCRTLSMSW